MAETTEKYGLRTPSQNNFFDVKDVSENMEKLENALTEFDDSGTVEDIKSFPDFLTKLVTGNKLAVTIRNLKAGLQFVLHAGQIVNNCVTDNAGLPLSAAQGKALMDKYTQLYSDLNTTNNNLSNAGIPTVKKITDLYAIKKSGFQCTYVIKRWHGHCELFKRCMDIFKCCTVCIIQNIYQLKI